MNRVKAAVSRQDSDLFQVEELAIDAPRQDEVLVRFTAAGLCHTDLEVAAGRMPTPFPVVAGHEGTGVVEDVGSAVTGFRPGDRVVASFSFCGTCRNCLSGRPAYCPQHFSLNFGAQRADGSVGLRDAAGEPVHDHFFGQSSFAGYGLCRPSSLVRIGSIVGHVAPAVLVPRILDLHGKGRFPLEAMIRAYSLDDIDKAVDDVRSGVTVKAVLLH